MRSATARAFATSATTPSEPGTSGTPSRAIAAFAVDLVAHHADMRRRRTDEGQPMRLHHLGEAGVLGQKAVAGMDRLGAGDRGGRQNGGDVQVAVLRRRRPDADAFVGQAHMHRLGVGGGMHRDGGNA